MRFLKKETMPNPKKLKNSKGQALIEYILLMATLSVVSIGFAKLVSEELFATGLQSDRLPAKVFACISHSKGLESQCQ